MMTDDEADLVAYGVANYMLTLRTLSGLARLEVIKSEDAIEIIDRACSDFETYAMKMSDLRVAASALVLLRTAKTSFGAEIQKRSGSVQ
jgi:hypothetical protein